MDKLSIKIKIADREYPMKVSNEDEEKIRKAGKVINERIKSYRDQFGIDDKQDLLAMVAFDSLVDGLEIKDQSVDEDDGLLNKVQHLNSIVSQII